MHCVLDEVGKDAESCVILLHNLHPAFPDQHTLHFGAKTIYMKLTDTEEGPK